MLKSYSLFILWILLLFFINSNPLHAQDQANEITQLHQKIIELETRIKELEKILNESILIPKSNIPGWYNKKNWRNLEVGMTQNQVNDILGEPIKIIQGKKILWYYPNIYGGVITFDEKGYLISWNEP